MDDIEEKGIDYVIVEGGEGVEKRFMDEKIVERMIILSQKLVIGEEDGVEVEGMEKNIKRELKIMRRMS